MYLRGCRFLPLRKIKVKFIDGDGFANSTCLLGLQLPTGLTEQYFEEYFDVIISSAKFSSVKFLYYLK